jgi:hypothetical protein
MIMSNVNISKLGWEVLMNKPLARAIVRAIVEGPYTEDGNGAIVRYEGKEFVINFWPHVAEINPKKENG